MFKVSFSVKIINVQRSVEDMKFTYEELVKVTKAQVLHCQNTSGLLNISTDSRNININDVYLPLKGERFNGHDFIKDAVKNDKALGAMVMNITSNMLGLSNAATPFGIKAMEELEKDNKNKGVATNDMALFLVLNTAAIQLIPTSVISIRAACGSANPAIIIGPAIVATGSAAIMGVIYCKILQRYF